MIYRPDALQYNNERQRWQVYCSVFSENLNDPQNPTPINDAQGILIDVANTSPTAVRQACTAFAVAVADGKTTASAALYGHMWSTDTGEQVDQNLNP